MIHYSYSFSATQKLMYVPPTHRHIPIDIHLYVRISVVEHSMHIQIHTHTHTYTQEISYMKQFIYKIICIRE